MKYLFVIIAVILAFFAGRYTHAPEIKESIIRDTTVIVDMEPDTVHLVSTQVVKLPVVQTVRDTVVQIDSVFVRVPISEYQFSDSTFRAVLTGYDVRLKEMNVFQTTRYKTITEKKKSRFGFGLQVGYGVMGGKFMPYLGVGGSFNIVSL